MIFDTLCGFAERGFVSEHVTDMVKRAKLFEFPGVPHEVLKRHYTDEQVESLRETFYLPFPVIAMEDPAICVLLTSMFDDRKLNVQVEEFWKNSEAVQAMADKIPVESVKADVLQMLKEKATENTELSIPFAGIDRPYIAIEISSLSVDNPGAFRNGDLYKKIVEGYNTDKDDYYIIVGTLSNLKLNNNNQWSAIYLPTMVMIVNKTKGCIELPEEILQNLGDIGYNVITALEEVLYFMAPDRFIVETKELHTKPAKKGHIPRSHQRPKYIALRPPEIRDRIGLGGTHASPHLHERRAHTRQLRSERYVNKKGQIIWVPATWVGQSEGNDGKRWYKVMLDK